VFAARSEPAVSRRSEATAFIARPLLPPKAVEAVKEVTGRSEAAIRSRRAPQVVTEAVAVLAAEAPQEADLSGPLRKVG
ncbi:MAG: hypothetical protein M3158_11845, partial [Pseudomonadota bacterium]|nr:hypothetical protein [Pseudomonadota bacterium]